MNWEVVRRDRPNEITGAAISTLDHVRVQHAERTLCGQSCTTMDYWFVREDWHPEDVDSIDRCHTCYRLFEARRRREREGDQSWRGQFALTGLH